MARAAAKRRPKAPEPPRRQKETRPKTVEDTLFFNRLRGQAKWVFVLLAVVFAGGFVIFGVGSDIGGGLSDIFSDNTSGGNTPSVERALKRTQDDPKNADAWRALGQAYEFDGKDDEAIQAWTTFTELRPKQTEGFNRLAGLYEAKANRQTDEARLAAFQAQAAAATDFQPPPTSPLGRAFADQPNRIAQTLATLANERYNTLLQERAQTLSRLVGVYTTLGDLEPEDSTLQLQLATAAQNAGNGRVALAAYEKFLTLVDPDHPQVPFVKQQIKALKAQLG